MTVKELFLIVCAGMLTIGGTVFSILIFIVSFHPDNENIRKEMLTLLVIGWTIVMFALILGLYGDTVIF